MQTLTIARIRNRLAKQIILFNLFIILITIVYYIRGAFDFEELSGVITLLTPLAAIYIGALFKYIGNILKNNPSDEDTKTFVPPFGRLLQWIVPIHYLVVFGIISLKAFSEITYFEMNLFLGLIEASFGVYMGYIINAIFRTE